MSIVPGEGGGGEELGPDELAARGLAETVPDDLFKDAPEALEALRAEPLGGPIEVPGGSVLGASGVITADGEQLPLPVQERRRRRLPRWAIPAVALGTAAVAVIASAVAVSAGSGSQAKTAPKHVAASTRRPGTKPAASTRPSPQPSRPAPHRRHHDTDGATTSALSPYGLSEPHSSTFTSVRGAAYDMILAGPGLVDVIASDNNGPAPDLFASYRQTGRTVDWAQWREQNGRPYVQGYGRLACRAGTATITSATRMSPAQAFSPVSVTALNSPDCARNVLKVPSLALNLALLAARQVVPGGSTQYFPSLAAYQQG